MKVFHLFRVGDDDFFRVWSGFFCDVTDGVRFLRILDLVDSGVGGGSRAVRERVGLLRMVSGVAGGSGRQTHGIRFTVVGDESGFCGVSTVVVVLGGMDVFKGC